MRTLALNAPWHLFVIETCSHGSKSEVVLPCVTCQNHTLGIVEYCAYDVASTVGTELQRGCFPITWVVPLYHSASGESIINPLVQVAA